MPYQRLPFWVTSGSNTAFSDPQEWTPVLGAFPLLLQLAQAHSTSSIHSQSLELQNSFPCEWNCKNTNEYVYFLTQVWEKYLRDDTGLQTFGIQEWITRYSAFKGVIWEYLFSFINFPQVHLFWIFKI